MHKPGQKTAMISSTARDLPEHRRMVMDACLRLGFRPIMMDHLSAQDRSATDVSVGIVADADVYLGIFAHAYGSSPDNDARSYTEIEFDQAVSLGITVIPFFVDEDIPWPPRSVDKGEKAEKLERLKAKVAKGRIIQRFKSPEDLRGLVIHALGQLETARAERDEPPKAPDFHPPNVIPKAPEPYLAHPYSLLQTKDVVGRHAELNLLTDWVTTNKQVPADTRIFNLVAIGGMGKSALTWKWFNDIAPNELPKLAGRMWWSFYESDAHWENFIIRALAYVSGQSEKAVREMKSPDREDQLWHILDQQPFLLVLDGLERILLAYARMDAAQMLDEDLNEKTANRVANAEGLCESTGIRKHHLRRATDHRAGQFLRRITRVKQSRFLITTRLYPSELQTDMGDALPGCFVYSLAGLEDADALALWREFKVSGSNEELLQIFRSFGNYPLVIRALAAEVATSRNAQRDFSIWRRANPSFNPARLNLANARTHVLHHALANLGKREQRLLETISAFRMPATWDALCQLMVRRGPQRVVFCQNAYELDASLAELENRGLIGWDKIPNRYDMHPAIRNIVWHAMEPAISESIYEGMQSYFRSLPRTKDWKTIRSLEQLTTVFELYNSLIELRRFHEAAMVFQHYLQNPLYYQLAANTRTVECLEKLLQQAKHNSLPRVMEYVLLNYLALGYTETGQLHLALSTYAASIDIQQETKDSDQMAINLANVAHVQAAFGKLYDAERSLRRALRIDAELKKREHEVTTLRNLAAVFGACGLYARALPLLARALLILSVQRDDFEAASIEMQSALFLARGGQINKARSIGRIAWSETKQNISEGYAICAELAYGKVLLEAGDIDLAIEHLEHNLNRARNAVIMREEIATTISLAKAFVLKQKLTEAYDLVGQALDIAERGPFTILQADALNVLAQIEHDQGNRDAAIAAATKAYTLAWCDGISADGKVCYAYHYGLTNARKHLQELGAPEPKLPPFDESKFEPLPDVELNPKDEFWVDPDKLDSP